MEKYKKLLNTDIELANLYIELATQAVLDYTNRLELLEAMKPLTFELAKHYLNEEKRQGVSSRSEGAISVSYTDTSTTDGIPAFVRSRLNKYKLLHVVNHKDK